MAARDLKHAEKEMHHAEKEFAAAEKAREKGDMKGAQKHELKGHELVAAAEQHAAHANAAANAILGTVQAHAGIHPVVPVHGGASHSFGLHHGAFHNNVWSGGFMHVAPTTIYNGHPIGDYDPLFNYAQGHPYHHSNFLYNSQPVGVYDRAVVYPAGHPYHGFGDHIRAHNTHVNASGHHRFGEHHGALNNGAWTGGFLNTSTTTVYNGKAIGNYDPFFDYPEDHPYHHRHFQHNGQPLGRYQHDAVYPEDHPYYAFRGHTRHGATPTGAINQAFNQTHRPHHGRWNSNAWSGGFLHVAPTTVYMGKPIGDYDPYFDYAEDHPYHHRNFQHNGKAIGRFNADTTYPEDHPFFGIGRHGHHHGAGVAAVPSGHGVPIVGGGVPVVGGGLPIGTGVPIISAPVVTTGPAVVQHVQDIHGSHHGTWANGVWLGGFGNVSPATIWEGRIIGSWNPLVIYPESHPYHHVNFHHGGSAIGAFTPGTNYPAGHPYQGIVVTGTPVPLFNHSHGSHHGGVVSGTSWEGGFMNVSSTTVYNGQPIGNYNPASSYPQGHPYHHGNFNYQNQPIGQYQAGTAYPQDHPYSGQGYHGAQHPTIIDKVKNAVFGPHHGNYNNGRWEGGFLNVAPTTAYQGQPIGHYNPGFAYAEDHPYHHRNFQYNGQPIGAYNATTVYPQDHPYYSLGAGHTSAAHSSLLGKVGHAFGPHHGTYNNGRWEGGFLNVAPTTVYQGQPIGHYNPGFAYAEDHPYHHRNFQYNGQPIGAYNASSAYPQDHPYYSLGAGHTSAAHSSVLGKVAHAFGPNHGSYNNGRWEGGFLNVAPTTAYQGQPIGHYNPGFNYPQDHPYHHSRFQHNGQPIGAYNASTVYPQDHPYYSLGAGHTSAAHSTLLGKVGHAFGPNHGSYNNGRWEGGFLNVAPTTAYQGQPIGHYNPGFNYPQDHPYHHSRFQHNGQPLGAFDSNASYPPEHPYFSLSNKGHSNQSTLGKIAHSFGPHHGSLRDGHWNGGFMNVAPTTLYKEQPIGHYNPGFNYPEDHPYHHRNFQHNGQPIGAYNPSSQYPQDHPYYGLTPSLSKTELAAGVGAPLGVNAGVRGGLL